MMRGRPQGHNDGAFNLCLNGVWIDVPTVIDYDLNLVNLLSYLEEKQKKFNFQSPITEQTQLKMMIKILKIQSLNTMKE